MNPVSEFTTTAAGSKMINRQSRERDDAESGCQAISLVSYLEAANERLRQAVEELRRETTALRQELTRKESGGSVAEAHDPHRK
jgi:hypothetical protein